MNDPAPSRMQEKQARSASEDTVGHMHIEKSLHLWEGKTVKTTNLHQKIETNRLSVLNKSACRNALFSMSLRGQKRASQGLVTKGHLGGWRRNCDVGGTDT